MRRYKGLVLTVLLVTALITACNPEPSQPNPPEPPAPPAPPTDPVTAPTPGTEGPALWRLDSYAPGDTVELSALTGDTVELSLDLRNIGEGEGAYRLDTGADWLKVSPGSGRLAPGDTDTALLTAECTQTGGKTTTLKVSGGAEPLAFTVNLSCDVLPVAKLELSNTAITLETSVGRAVSGQFRLSNTGTAQLELNLQTDASWLALSSSALTLEPATSEALSLTATCTSGPGEYSARVSVRDSAAQSIQEEVEVTLVCLAPPPAPRIPKLSVPKDLTVKQLLNSTETATLELQNTGEAELSFELSTAAPWLNLTQDNGEIAAGANQTLTLTVTCAASPVSDTATLSVSSNDPNTPLLAVTVKRVCYAADTPRLTILEPNPLAMATEVSTSAFSSINIKNTGTSPLTFTLSADEPWVDDIDTTTRTLAAGEQRPDLIGVRCGAAATLRNATLTLTTNDQLEPVQTIPLQLTCGAPPSVTLRVTLEGQGQGVVTSKDEEIRCGATCEASFARGTELTLRAQATGDSSFTSWTGGPCAGRQGDCSFRLTETLNLGASFSAAPAEGYSIVLRFSDDNVSPQQRRVFERAAARWSAVITRDVADYSIDVAQDNCFSGVPAFKGTADDLIIDVTAPELDGLKGRLGYAGPCELRLAEEGKAAGLPAFGFIRLDRADLDNRAENGTLLDLILHEMGHVLGIGTLWQPLNLLDYETANCLDANRIDYTGERGVAAYASYGASGAPPVEAVQGGTGTRCAHWSNARFGNELMTGFINEGGNPLSRMTIASLADMGYAVDYGAADPYTLGTVNSQASGDLLKEILIVPPLP